MNIIFKGVVAKIRFCELGESIPICLLKIYESFVSSTGFLDIWANGNKNGEVVGGKCEVCCPWTGWEEVGGGKGDVGGCVGVVSGPGGGVLVCYTKMASVAEPVHYGGAS